jgi:hypothetical protein
MNRFLLTSALLAFTCSVRADSLPDRADEVVSYNIKVRLDPVQHQLHGVERLTWKNPSPEPVGDLWLHLYLNAFKNSKSTFFAESGGRNRGFAFTEGKWGWINVDSMRLPGGVDLKPGLRFEHPDDSNTADQTVARVPLPEPVPPGGSVTLDIAFTAQLPEVFARTGYKREFYLVGQWFPKVGVYETAGMRGRPAAGWNCHQFHASTEFYADYGSYHVEITTPSKFVVGATGRRVSVAQNQDGTTTRVYEERNIHDFAWTANPNFVEVNAVFSGSRDVSAAEYEQTARMLGRTLDEVRLSDVDITVLLDPAHQVQAARHIEAAKVGIKYYGLWYGRYPYRTLTVVDPAPGAAGAGGMEYPTFITAGTHTLLNSWPLDKVRMPELVTIHEFGHQFWYGMVGNNEFEEAWLDEGINSYSTGRAMQAGYGRNAPLIDVFGFRLSELDSIRMQNSPEARFNAILNFAWKYEPAGTYGFYSYTKPEIALLTLENYLGSEKMSRVMRTFHERWRFRHPQSADFFAVANEISGQDLGWYFDATIRRSGVLDYQVNSMSSRKVEPGVGVFDRDGKQETIDRKEAERRQEKAESAGAKPEYESVVTIGRRGEVIFPVEVEVKFKGVPPERRLWDGKTPAITYRWTRPEELEWVNVDPDRNVLLDVDWLNNARRMEPDSRTATKWGARYMFWVQNLLALIGM